MSNDSDALIREVNEELRRDQLKQIWDEYGTYILMGAAAIVFGVGGYKWWEGRKIAAAEAQGARFEEAMSLLDTGKPEDAQKLFQAIAGERAVGYATVAQLALAGNAVKAGKADEAIAAYETIAKTSSDALVKDFARLQIAALKVDTADFTEVQNRLNDLIGDKNPWRYTARELLGLAAIKAGKLEEARQTLAPLSSDFRAPAAIRERSGAMMNLVVAAELEKSAPATVEIEKTDDPSAKAAEPPAKPEPPRAKAPPKGGPAAGSKK